MVVLIDSSWAQSDVSFVLFHVRFGPSSKSNKIIEWWALIVVGIPKRMCTQTRACFLTSHNWSPHVLWRINSYTFAMRFNPVNNFSQVIAVGCMVTAPSTSWTWVSLDINPHCPIKVARDGGHHLVDLGISWFSSAGEHVDISGKTSWSSVVEIWNDIGIDSSVRAVSSDDDIVIVIVFEAGVGRGSKVLADVYS